MEGKSDSERRWERQRGNKNRNIIMGGSVKQCRDVPLCFSVNCHFQTESTTLRSTAFSLSSTSTYWATVTVQIFHLLPVNGEIFIEYFQTNRTTMANTMHEISYIFLYKTIAMTHISWAQSCYLHILNHWNVISLWYVSNKLSFNYLIIIELKLV